MFLEGHYGRHSSKYHEYVLSRLRKATEGQSGEEYTTSLKNELDALKGDLQKNPDMIRGIGL
jgi:hypothetical protein